MKILITKLKFSIQKALQMSEKTKNINTLPQQKIPMALMSKQRFSLQVANTLIQQIVQKVLIKATLQFDRQLIEQQSTTFSKNMFNEIEGVHRFHQQQAQVRRQKATADEQPQIKKTEKYSVPEQKSINGIICPIVYSIKHSQSQETFGSKSLKNKKRSRTVQCEIVKRKISAFLAVKRYDKYKKQRDLLAISKSKSNQKNLLKLQAYTKSLIPENVDSRDTQEYLRKLQKAENEEMEIEKIENELRENKIFEEELKKRQKQKQKFVPKGIKSEDAGRFILKQNVNVIQVGISEQKKVKKAKNALNPILVKSQKTKKFFGTQKTRLKLNLERQNKEIFDKYHQDKLKHSEQQNLSITFRDRGIKLKDENFEQQDKQNKKCDSLISLARFEQNSKTKKTKPVSVHTITTNEENPSDFKDSSKLQTKQPRYSSLDHDRSSSQNLRNRKRECKRQSGFTYGLVEQKKNKQNPKMKLQCFQSNNQLSKKKDKLILNQKQAKNSDSHEKVIVNNQRNLHFLLFDEPIRQSQSYAKVEKSSYLLQRQVGNRNKKIQSQLMQAKKSPHFNDETNMNKNCKSRLRKAITIEGEIFH